MLGINISNKIPKFITTAILFRKAIFKEISQATEQNFFSYFPASILSNGVELLGLDAVQNLPPESVDLLDELGPQLVHGDVSQVLEHVLLGQWTNHGATVAFLKERLEQATDAILLIDGLTKTLLILECFLEVLFGGDGLLVLVD